MKVRSLKVLIHQSMKRQLLWLTIIQSVIVGLIVFYPLAGCANSLDASGTKAIITTTPKATQTPSVLVWSDEFNGPKGSVPDPSKWTPDIGGEGWGNEQLEYDTNNQNVYQDGQGNLVIEARKDSSMEYKCWYGRCQYTSGRITTNGHFSFTYGRIEARIKLPAGQGLWPTFWLLGDNCDKVGWPACGEIDVMENISREPATNYGVVHGPKRFISTYKLPQGVFSNDFHIFALQWDPDHLYFFVDGINYFTVKKSTITNQTYWVFDHPFYIILNVAVGGWAGTPRSKDVFPQKMYVSYVRFYTNG